jgi:hypothetical protein
MEDDMEETDNNAAVPANGAEFQPLGDEEIAALAAAARDLVPSVEWVGLELKFAYVTGKWSVKINSEEEEEVGATEIFKVDVRSYAELYKRWGKVEGRSKRAVTDMIGGRRVDGWINPPRHLMPEYDKSKWPLGDNGDRRDPWQETSQIVLRRVSDGQLVTWSAQYSNRRGMGELLDAVASECREHPGCAPLVLLEAVAKGENFNPRLRIVGWEPFGDGASPPANSARAERLKEDLQALHAKYAPKAAAKRAPLSDDGMGDAIPF